MTDKKDVLKTAFKSLLEAEISQYQHIESTGIIDIDEEVKNFFNGNLSIRYDPKIETIIFTRLNEEKWFRGEK